MRRFLNLTKVDVMKKASKKKPPPRNKVIKHEWNFETISGNVHRLIYDLKVQQKYETLWISDLHWDNPHCDRALLKRHLDQAVEKDTPVVIVGDLFCAMQGKYDKRSNKEDIRPEHQTGVYLDSLVETAIEWFEPYRHVITLVGYGNHETSIQSHHETDLLDRFTAGLRRAGGITQAGGYNGWVQYKMNYRTMRKSYGFFYAHGAGGGAPVTKGLISFNRWREQVTADAYIAGHIHRLTNVPNVVNELTTHGKPVRSQMDYIRCSTYKDECGDGAHGYHNENQRGPRPLGGWWCEWVYDASRTQFNRRWIPTD